MSKMNELSQVLDEMVACGQRLIDTAEALKAVFTADPEPKPEPARPEEPAKPKYTFTDVRKAFSAKSHAGFTEQVKALITKYGADKLSAVKEEDYESLMADLEEIR